MLLQLLHALTDAVAAAACVGEFEFGRSFLDVVICRYLYDRSTRSWCLVGTRHRHKPPLYSRCRLSSNLSNLPSKSNPIQSNLIQSNLI